MESAGSLKKTVYNELMGDIVKGELRANDIVTENSLIQRFSVSKAPVREALIELCKDGFLRSLPRYGYQVVQCTVPEIIEMLGPVYRNAMEIGFRKSLENEFENMLRLFHNAGGNEAARLLLGKIRRNMCKVTWHLYEEEVPPEENETYYLLVDILEKERDPFQIFDPNVPLPVIDKRRGGCSATSAGMLP